MHDRCGQVRANHRALSSPPCKLCQFSSGGQISTSPVLMGRQDHPDSIGSQEATPRKTSQPAHADGSVAPPVTEHCRVALAAVGTILLRILRVGRTPRRDQDGAARARARPGKDRQPPGASGRRGRQFLEERGSRQSRSQSQSPARQSRSARTNISGGPEDPRRRHLCLVLGRRLHRRGRLDG